MNLFSDLPSEDAEMLIGIIIGFFIVFVIFGGGVFVFKALGIYNMSKKRGLPNPWLAFIPVANDYMLGAIYDDTNRCALKNSNMRYFLLSLTAVTTGVIFFAYPIAFINLFNDAFSSDSNISNGVPMTFLLLPICALLCNAQRILSLVILYRVYGDYSKRNQVMFILLSIFVNLTPFILFGIRNNQSASIYYKNLRENPPQYNQQQYNQQQYNPQQYNPQQYNRQQYNPQQQYNQQQYNPTNYNNQNRP